MKLVRIVAALLLVMAIGWSLRPAAAHDKDAPMGPTKLHSPIPILNVKSVEKSIEHYTTVLGFDKHWDWPGDKPDKTFASITNGKAEIFLCEGGQGSSGTWVYYGVDNIDDLHRQYVAAKADIMSPPADKPWGMREMLVRDIDGHVLRIGQGIDQPATKPAEK
jgi:uncharacterized glyoxalase superfamily protein PhnB